MKSGAYKAKIIHMV